MLSPIGITSIRSSPEYFGEDHVDVAAPYALQKSEGGKGMHRYYSRISHSLLHTNHYVIIYILFSIKGVQVVHQRFYPPQSSQWVIFSTKRPASV